MFEMFFPFIVNGIMSFMATGLSFRAWVLPAIVKSRLEREFIKKELLLLRDSHTKMKQDYYSFKEETKINFTELAQNDSTISKRQDTIEGKMDKLISTNESIDNHFVQMIELLKNK
jgi:hypothetical protein